MIREYYIYSAEKATVSQEGLCLEFEDDQTDKCYESLCEELQLNDESDLIDFQNCNDKDVPSMMADLENMKFIEYDEVAY